VGLNVDVFAVGGDCSLDIPQSENSNAVGSSNVTSQAVERDDRSPLSGCDVRGDRPVAEDDRLVLGLDRLRFDLISGGGDPRAIGAVDFAKQLAVRLDLQLPTRPDLGVHILNGLRADPFVLTLDLAA